MATTVEVPKLSNTVEDRLVAAWRTHKGDTVPATEIRAEIETDNSIFDLIAPVESPLLETLFEEGALVSVSTALCAIGAPGESTAGPGATNAAPGRRATMDHGASGSATRADVTNGPVANGPLRDEAASALSSVSARPGSGSAITPDAGPALLSPRVHRFPHEHDIHLQVVGGTRPLGPALYTAQGGAANELAPCFNVSTQILDQRSADPLNYDLFVASVKKPRQHQTKAYHHEAPAQRDRAPPLRVHLGRALVNHSRSRSSYRTSVCPPKRGHIMPRSGTIDSKNYCPKG